MSDLKQKEGWRGKNWLGLCHVFHHIFMFIFIHSASMYHLLPSTPISACYSMFPSLRKETTKTVLWPGHQCYKLFFPESVRLYFHRLHQSSYLFDCHIKPSSCPELLRGLKVRIYETSLLHREGMMSFGKQATFIPSQLKEKC